MSSENQYEIYYDEFDKEQPYHLYDKVKFDELSKDCEKYEIVKFLDVCTTKKFKTEQDAEKYIKLLPDLEKKCKGILLCTGNCPCKKEKYDECLSDMTCEDCDYRHVCLERYKDKLKEEIDGKQI